MSTARNNHGVAVVGDKIYVMGGSFGGVLGNNEVYDSLTSTWINKTPIPTSRLGFGIGVVEKKIYVIGGRTTQIPTTNLNEVYDPLIDIWETRTPMPTSRTYVVANEVNGKIYVMAGCTFPHPSFPELCNKTEVYDPITDSWTEKAQMPNFTGYGMGENVASAVLDNTIYVTVGETLHIYSPNNDSWSLGASVQTTIYGGAAMGATTGESATKNLYLFGGWGDYLNPLNLTQVYDPQENVWSYAAQMLSPRYGHKVATLNDILYVIGGTMGEVGTGTQTNLNEQYIPLDYVPEFPSESTIYIRANGSVEGTDKIQIDGDVYTFISDINGSIRVERDNVVLNGAGYRLQGDGNQNGITLRFGNNITVNNLQLSSFHIGIVVMGSDNNKILENTITDNFRGLDLTGSENNTVSGNYIANNVGGIALENMYNSIVENTITNNSNLGIHLYGAGYNNIIGNNITNNGRGILVSICYNNVIYHNNFVNNTNHVETDDSNGIWNNGEEGNYWDDYTGVDNDGDGIGDTPYVIDDNNRNNFPRMNPWIPPNQKSEPFPITWILVIIGIIAIVGAAILVFLQKTKWSCVHRLGNSDSLD